MTFQMWPAAMIIKKYDEKAHTRPFEQKWLNIVAAIIVPVGIVLYLRMWRFRLRLYRDLNVIRQSNANIISQINLSATVMGTGGGIGYTAENNNNFFDIGVFEYI